MIRDALAARLFYRLVMTKNAYDGTHPKENPVREKLYLIGPMTGYPDHNVKAFDFAAAMLRARGYDVTTPVDMNRAAGLDFSKPLPAGEYEKWMKADLLVLLDVDVVAMLPGWEKSKGAKVEHAVAEILSKRLLYLTRWDF